MSRSRQEYSIHDHRPNGSTNTCLPNNCELRLLNFYAAVLLEGLGVLLLVFIGGSEFVKFDVKKHEYVLEIAVVYGVTLAIITHCLRNISDSHINPAITIACLITRRVSILRGLCYIISQLCGSIIGSVLLRAMVPSTPASNYSLTRLATNVTIIIGIVYEMLFTFIYSVLYFSFTSQKSKSAFKVAHAPFSLGLFYAISHIVIIDKTGCSLNPARSFGPAIVNNDFRGLWIYFAGPILASSLGVLMYDLMLKKSINQTHPRARSLSLVCCKPSREEIILRENQDGYDQDLIVRKAEDVV